MAKEKEEKTGEKTEKPSASPRKPVHIPSVRVTSKQPVGRLARAEKVSAPILAGVMQATGWAPETEVTPQDFKKRVSEWANKKVGG